jgi:hypothetical protein
MSVSSVTPDNSIPSGAAAPWLASNRGLIFDQAITKQLAHRTDRRFFSFSEIVRIYNAEYPGRAKVRPRAP